jgi:manganese catalase
MSQGEDDRQGPWNSGEQWEVVSDRKSQAAVDGGEGDARVKLSRQEEQLLSKAAARTESRADAKPLTGADLGPGPGAGSTKSPARAKLKR